MKQKSGSLLAALPLAYALMITLFLYLHFSRFEDVSRVIGNVSYKGTKTEATDLSPSSVRSLDVYANGLQLEFGRRKHLTVITEDGISRDLKIENLERTERGLGLLFKYDIRIDIDNIPQSSNCTVNVTVPQSIPPIKELILHAKPSESFLISLDEQERMTLSNGTNTYFLNPSGDISYDEGRLLISMTDRISNNISIEDEAPGLGRSVREWLAESDSSSLSGVEMIDDFGNRAYAGWNARFDRNSGDWTIPGSSPAFDEDALVLFMSEAYRRSEYSLFSADLLKAADKNSSDLSWYSSPFTGDIVNKTASLVRSGAESLLAQKRALPLSGNPDLSPYKEILELQSILEDPAAESSGPWIEENIYPLIVWLEEGLYIFHPDNPVCDSLYALETAELLERAALTDGDSEMQAISLHLRNSILSRADENGVLPARISFSQERASQAEGIILPEDIFTYFEDDAYSVRAMDLSEELGTGSWLYTSARSISATKDRESLQVDVNFPRGQIHHLLIKGVEPFDRIYLHNIRWKSDPRFQRYSDGWVYDSVNKTLYIKIKHRSTKESIRIVYQAPAAPPAPASAPAEMTESTTSPAQSEAPAAGGASS